MKEEERAVYRKCDCGCCVLEVSKTTFDDGEVDYDIAVLDSRYDHKANGAWNRVRRAVKALFGKPVYFNDVYIRGDAEFDALLDELRWLRES